MKDRLKEIRENSPFGKTQKAFADYLGISSANLASYETGRRTPTDAVVQLICQKCSINEEWLRTGEGEKDKPLTRSQEIGGFMSEVMDMKDDAFVKRFVEALTKLDTEDWECIERISTKLLNNN